jgi:hypothetical protein
VNCVPKHADSYAQNRKQARTPKYYADAHAQHFKVAGLLVAAHGSGLGASITILKDAASTRQFAGIGAFFILFGIGLIASILYYVSVFMTRATVRSALMSDHDPNDEPSASLLKGLNVTMTRSL